MTMTMMKKTQPEDLMKFKHKQRHNFCYAQDLNMKLLVFLYYFQRPYFYKKFQRPALPPTRFYEVRGVGGPFFISI